MPHYLKERINHFTKSQLRNNSEKSKECLESEYRCVKCRDLKFIIYDGVATPCECKEIREAEEILKRSGISEEFRKKRFDNYDYMFNVQCVDAYKKALNYVRSFDDIRGSRKNSIVFMGQVGSGKTHLSMAIANELMDNGVSVVYMGYRDVIVALKQNIMDEENYRKMMGRFLRCKVLLVDDLFKGSVSKSDVNIIFEIVNFRYFNNLHIIVSTEKRFDELIDIDEAVGSRIIEMGKEHLVEIKGKK